MHIFSLVAIYLFYGLAFFSMGLIVYLESGRAADERMRRALRPLAGFGIIHGLHEWQEMFSLQGILPGQEQYGFLWEGLRMGMLTLSFLSLTAFGASLLSPTSTIHRLSLLVPLLQAAIWGFGVLMIRNNPGYWKEYWDVADVWTRYSVGIPAALIACAGLIVQQRYFRMMGLERFGRDSLWAAVAFAWYGLVGQIFTRQTSMPISHLINQNLFFDIFGFPVQLLRAVSAIVAATFVVRFLRSFEVETQRRIEELQNERIQEAMRREAIKSELFRRVISAQEAERQRIARELHDETGQALTAIGMGLRGAASTLRQDVDKTASLLRQLEGTTANALNELRRLIADLRPSHLDDLGLPAALRWYAKEVQERTGIEISVDVGDTCAMLTPAVKTALFRIFQEALSNVVKHANASAAWVNLDFKNGTVTLIISDNGSGFDVEKVRQSGQPTWGLLGMEERATLCGGTFEIKTRPGSGTKVTVEVPCNGGEIQNHD